MPLAYNKKQKIEKGRLGEVLAASFLKKNGYEIIETNYRTRIGEIDLIAKDQQTVCFVEVKARTSLGLGYPEESITRHKQMKLAKSAKVYLLSHHLVDVDLRFDVVSVLLSEDGSAQIDLLKDAFDIAA